MATVALTDDNLLSHIFSFLSADLRQVLILKRVSKSFRRTCPLPSHVTYRLRRYNNLSRAVDRATFYITKCLQSGYLNRCTYFELSLPNFSDLVWDSMDPPTTSLSAFLSVIREIPHLSFFKAPCAWNRFPSNPVWFEQRLLAFFPLVSRLEFQVKEVDETAVGLLPSSCESVTIHSFLNKDIVLKADQFKRFPNLQTLEWIESGGKQIWLVQTNNNSLSRLQQLCGFALQGSLACCNYLHTISLSVADSILPLPASLRRLRTGTHTPNGQLSFKEIQAVLDLSGIEDIYLGQDLRGAVTFVIRSLSLKRFGVRSASVSVNICNLTNNEIVLSGFCSTIRTLQLHN